MVLGGTTDPTEGAQYYYDNSISWPKAWGKESEYVNTLNVGRLKFYRFKGNNHDDVQSAVQGDA